MTDSQRISDKFYEQMNFENEQLLEKWNRNERNEKLLKLRLKFNSL